MTRQDIRNEIENIEYSVYHGCFSVHAKNIRVRKEKIIADVVLYDEDMKQTVYDCEYPIRLFSKINP